MKRLIIFMIFFLIKTIVLSQNPESISLTREISTSNYSPEKTDLKIIKLETGFSGKEILNPQLINSLENSMIISIDLVFSDYPHLYHHQPLARERLISLQKLLPEVFNYKKLEWKFIKQTNCHDQLSAKELFHGFVIGYKPKQSKELIKEELAYLESMLSVTKPSLEIIDSDLSSETLSNISLNQYLMLKDSATMAAAIEHNNKLEDYKFECRTSSEHVPPALDSTIFKVFARNKWSKMLIVSDLTGSMSPFTAQLILWFKLNSDNRKVNQFVFFNDGDNTPDHKKLIGQIGGIYTSEASSFEEIKKLATQTMRNGNGGDAPENDIEALLKGERECPHCTSTILIADNWANIKDIKNATKLTEPVKIILCGAHFGVNTQYLNLARLTGGSVHTMESDLERLIEIKEGSTIELDGQLFELLGGKFERVFKI